MVKKIHKTSGDEAAAAGPSSAQLASTVRESAQQIWLAGLGAFSKAQEEGGKVFEALVKEGVGLQRKTQAAAEGKLSEATTRMSAMATDLSSKATGQWDKLENIFEDRVARALKSLGVPTAKDVAALAARVEELNRNVARMNGGAASPARRVAKKAPAGKAAAKAPRKTARKAAE
ncbi:phasin family protein [Ramlibacter sp. XY19]|uniref:phasin family protein n=1 Tax=Ramlibacter paludis TaxID=2908000 RepID=UPI0023DBEB2C|nr:phasin family protein [Ramlibacter paludis]MCG2591245.1 phasin family protein [Ramlibacter paludis]